jgi:hypothetical protein
MNFLEAVNELRLDEKRGNQTLAASNVQQSGIEK